MSKLHRSESLESLISSAPIPSNRKHRSTTRIWVILTYVNFCIIVATLVVAGTTLRVLQGSKENSKFISGHSHAPAPSHEHPRTPLHSLPASQEWSTCGNTSAQAIENGCVFDLMLSTWLHPECYWHEHSSTALDAANLTFFLDEELTIPFDDAGSGNWPQHYLWTQPGYHALHCSYMWERQIMAWTSGNRIDTQCWNLGHTKHCAMTVLESNSPHPYKSARLRRGFSDCGRP